MKSVQGIVVLLWMLAVSLQVVAGAEPDAKAAAGPPELGVAVMAERGNIELHRFVVRMVARTTDSELPPGLKIEATQGTIGPTSTTQIVPVVETQTAQYDATKVLARRLDGRAVSQQELAEALRKPTPVIYATQGQPLDPLFSPLFKPECLVLLLPPSTAAPTIAPENSAPVTRPR